ncbi:hypothetical protein FVEN_g12920 [Fusarium venenatum]|nr:hypothetical protein FVEN_g12920 [Fusarium venenatum]
MSNYQSKDLSPIRRNRYADLLSKVAYFMYIKITNAIKIIGMPAGS